MMVSNSQICKHEDEDDDEDLEALRLAALKSLKTKSSTCTKSSSTAVQSVVLQINTTFPSHNSNRSTRKEYYHSHKTSRQNRNAYHFSKNNQNLIEIVPVEENVNGQNESSQTVKSNSPLTADTEDSKFYRFKDNESTSEDEDQTNSRFPSDSINKKEKNNKDNEANKENQSGEEECPRKVDKNIKSVEDNGDTERSDKDSNKDNNDSDDVNDNENHNINGVGVDVDDEDDDDDDNDNDDDDEHNNNGDFDDDDDENDDDDDNNNDDVDDDVLLMADLEEEDSLERLMNEMEKEMKGDKLVDEKDKKVLTKENIEMKKYYGLKARKSKEASENIDSYLKLRKHDRRSASPCELRKRRQLLRAESRRKSLKRLSKRSASRQGEKSQRDDSRALSPRKSSSSLRMLQSPRCSPMNYPVKRSPKRFSPRRSHSRSPLRWSSRSPKITSRSRSPRNTNRVRSPKSSPSKSSNDTPGYSSPRPRSPVFPLSKVSPSFVFSEKLELSPQQSSWQERSPHYSPRRSPWSSPRNSPRLSPRRRSPVEDVFRKSHCSKTPDDYNHKSEISPSKSKTSSNSSKSTKKKSVAKEFNNSIHDPVLEARRRKFETTRLIDPVNDNKKIKLNSKVSMTKLNLLDDKELDTLELKAQKLLEEMAENELCLNDLSDSEKLTVKNDSDSEKVSMEVVPVQVKERTKKKKKKDKELYRVGKLRGELPLSERIGKEKKNKKKTHLTSKNSNDDIKTSADEILNEETDLRTELSRRRAERLNRAVPFHSARLLQSAFKGVVKDVVKNNAKITPKHLAKGDDKNAQKEIRRVTILHRSATESHDSEDETVDLKIPVRLRLGINKSTTCESKSLNKLSKRQSRKGKKKSH